MTHSDSIKDLAAALAKAQLTMKNAKKDSANPFFKSKYADLAAVSEACREQLATNGIAVVQTPCNGENGTVGVTTILMHASGQWIEDTVRAVPKDTGAQAMGSVITYLRRYALASFVGVASEDDDAEAGEGRSKAHSKQAPMAKPEGYDAWMSTLTATAAKGNEALQAAWRVASLPHRTYLLATNGTEWEALKASALTVKPAAVVN